MSYYFGILKNETEDDHLEWVNSFKDSSYEIKYKIIDITKEDWIKNILNDNFDCFLARPPGSINYFKQLYDERLYFINKVLNKKIYPSFEELIIYENKKMLLYWLEANNIPHPHTWIFYNKKDAINFTESCKFPIVAKTSIGASGSGVKIIKDKEKLKKYIEKAFSKKGISRYWGPNLRKDDIKKRFLSRISNPPSTIQYFLNKRNRSTIDRQKFFVILQEYIKCKFEWRCVRVGNSFFGHKKLPKYGMKFSGSSNVSWDPPSKKLLDFVKNITDKRNFLSQAVDIFEPEPGKFLVNEMQCFWGSKNPHQMIIRGKPGRYTLKNSKWIFEEGNFNKNNSYNLRLENVINLMQNNEL